jgi:hypothetical protein
VDPTVHPTVDPTVHPTVDLTMHPTLDPTVVLPVSDTDASDGCAARQDARGRRGARWAG